MSPDAFKAIRKDRLRISQQKMADKLGLSLATIRLYEAGKRFDSDQLVKIPKSVRLALYAIVNGVNDWDGSNNSDSKEGSHD